MATFSQLPHHPSIEVAPFEINIPDSQIDALKTLLSLTPIGKPTFENSGPEDGWEGPFGLGMRREWMESAVKTWREDFDWRKHETYMNSFPNFIAKVHLSSQNETYNVHFTALFSPKSDATPLFFFHGWPGSFLEFLPIMAKLRHQYAQSAEEFPYHIIAPSLVGTAFSSSPPVSRNFDNKDQAEIMHALAVGLGFEKYAVQGGDIGSRVARYMAARFDECQACHLNFCHMHSPPKGYSAESLSGLEKAGVERAHEFMTSGNSYALEHGTRPATISFVLSSNPVALLAWIAEKFLAWSDQDPSIGEILESVTLYWFTESFATSIHQYRQRFVPGSSPGDHMNPDYYIHKPLGYSYFKYELAPCPVEWVKTTGNLVAHEYHESGGHFAAMEKPDELWEDIDTFLKKCQEQAYTK